MDKYQLYHWYSNKTANKWMGFDSSATQSQYFSPNDLSHSEQFLFPVKNNIVIIFRLASFLRCLLFLGFFILYGCLHFWGCHLFWSCLQFQVVFNLKVVFIFRLPSLLGYLHFEGCHHFGGCLRFQNIVNVFPEFNLGS